MPKMIVSGCRGLDLMQSCVALFFHQTPSLSISDTSLRYFCTFSLCLCQQKHLCCFMIDSISLLCIGKDVWMLVVIPKLVCVLYLLPVQCAYGFV